LGVKKLNSAAELTQKHQLFCSPLIPKSSKSQPEIVRIPTNA